MKIAILTLDPRNGGSILHSLLVTYNFLRQWGKPTVFFLDFTPQHSTSMHNSAQANKITPLQLYGMNCVSISSKWAFWEPGHYHYTLPQWREALQGYCYFFVTSGTAIAAHPLALLQKPFVAWLATSLAGDRTGKSISFNPFRRLIAGLCWPSMLQIEQMALQSCSFLLPMSRYTQHSLQHLVSPKTPQVVCGYPVECRQALGAKNATPTVISIAKFSDPRKNLAGLLQAWKLVLKQIPQAQLQLVGDLTTIKLDSCYRQLLATGQLQLYSTVSQADKFKLLQRAHVAVIASYQEGLCIAGLEAAACGLPVVSTDCGGPKDYVLDGLTGFIVPTAQPEMLAQKICKLLQQPTLATKLGSQGQSLVQHFYNKDRIFEKFAHAMISTWPELKPHFARNL